VSHQKPIVGVVTIYDLSNFGNRLQNWAVHKVLRDRGYSPVNMVYPRKTLRSHISNVVHLHWLRQRLYFNTPREQRFAAFSRLMQTKTIHTPLGLRTAAHGCACVVVGSDQIWNPYFYRPHPFEFLEWTDGSRRIALAPSFGVSEIPPEYRSTYAQLLTGFPRLSTREDAGAAIIQELTGKQAEVLIDPTLSISAEEWRAIADNSLRPKTPYVLTYFLGAISPERRTYIQDAAQRRGAAIVDLLDPSDPHTYAAGPAEFLDLIDNAECVFTDSFHGSAFSLLFSTPFVIFDRESNMASMSSRIETFVETFGLQMRKYTPHTDMDPFVVDYADAHLILKQKREQYFAYLDEELARVRNYQPPE